MSSSTSWGNHPEQPPGQHAVESCITIQPHGLLLVLREPLLRIVQASTNAAALLSRPLDSLLLATLHELGGDIDTRLRQWLDGGSAVDALPLRCALNGGRDLLHFEATIHRVGPDALALELEPLPAQPRAPAADAVDTPLLPRLQAAMQRIGAAEDLETLYDSLADEVQALSGHALVLVGELQAESNGRLLATAHSRQHLPLFDAGALWQACVPADRDAQPRLQTLVDLDAGCCELVPSMQVGNEATFDLSRCTLGAGPLLRRQRLQALGVRAWLRLSLQDQGRPYGLLTCLDGAPRRLSTRQRAALELLAEVAADRRRMLQQQLQAQIGLRVDRLERRLLAAIADDGDWRQALFQPPQEALQALHASGMLMHYDDQVLRCGELPADEPLRQFLQWLDTQPGGVPAQADLPADDSFRGAGRLLAVRLSARPGECLLWLRAPDAAAPAADARPWSAEDLALASAYGRVLADIVVQVSAVRLLIAESQLVRLQGAVIQALEPVVVADAQGRCRANAAFLALAGRGADESELHEGLAALFTDETLVRAVLGQLRAEQRPWRGELSLRQRGDTALPVRVRVRAEPVPAHGHGLLGTLFLFEALKETRGGAGLAAPAPWQAPEQDSASAFVSVSSAAALLQRVRDLDPPSA